MRSLLELAESHSITFTCTWQHCANPAAVSASSRDSAARTQAVLFDSNNRGVTTTGMEQHVYVDVGGDAKELRLPTV